MIILPHSEGVLGDADVLGESEDCDAELSMPLSSSPFDITSCKDIEDSSPAFSITLPLVIAHFFYKVKQCKSAEVARYQI